MQLNLKTGILTLVAAISLVACSESYPGMLYDESGSKATNTEGLDSANLVPLYVYVNKQSFFSVTATPGPPLLSDQLPPLRLPRRQICHHGLGLSRRTGQ